MPHFSGVLEPSRSCPREPTVPSSALTCTSGIASLALSRSQEGVYTTEPADATDHLSALSCLFRSQVADGSFSWLSSTRCAKSDSLLDELFFTNTICICIIKHYLQVWENLFEIMTCLVGNSVMKLLFFPFEANDITDTHIYVHNAYIFWFLFIWLIHVCMCLHVYNETSSGDKIRFPFSRCQFQNTESLLLISDLKTSVSCLYKSFRMVAIKVRM